VFGTSYKASSDTGSGTSFRTVGGGCDGDGGDGGGMRQGEKCKRYQSLIKRRRRRRKQVAG